MTRNFSVSFSTTNNSLERLIQKNDFFFFQVMLMWWRWSTAPGAWFSLPQRCTGGRWVEVTCSRWRLVAGEWCGECLMMGQPGSTLGAGEEVIINQRQHLNTRTAFRRWEIRNISTSMRIRGGILCQVSPALVYQLTGETDSDDQR